MRQASNSLCALCESEREIVKKCQNRFKVSKSTQFVHVNSEKKKCEKEEREGREERDIKEREEREILRREGRDSLIYL